MGCECVCVFVHPSFSCAHLCECVTFDGEADTSLGSQSWHRRHSSNTHVLSSLIVGDILYWQRAILREHLRALEEHTHTHRRRNKPDWTHAMSIQFFLFILSVRMWRENSIVNIYFEGTQLRWESRGGTFTHAVPKRGDNRSKSVLHDEPVSCNSSQLLLIGILLMKNKHVSTRKNQQVSEFLSHPGDTTIDTQATTTGLTVEEQCVHHKWRRREEYQQHHCYHASVEI